MTGPVGGAAGAFGSRTTGASRLWRESGRGRPAAVSMTTRRLRPRPPRPPVWGAAGGSGGFLRSRQPLTCQSRAELRGCRTVLLVGAAVLDREHDLLALLDRALFGLIAGLGLVDVLRLGGRLHDLVGDVLAGRLARSELLVG